MSTHRVGGCSAPRFNSPHGSVARATLLATCLLSLTTACANDDEGSATVESPPLNLVLVTIDTLRRDHLGCYDYFRDTSPQLDALAAESLVFDDLQAHVAQTLPSHTSLFTGLAPSEHGIESNISWLKGSYVPSPKIRSLATVLGEQHYSTAGFISATPLAKGSGAEVGFQEWGQPEVELRRGDLTVDDAIAWLAGAPSEPWFLWVHLFDPHHPYAAPAEYRRFGPSAAQTDYLGRLGIPESVEMPKKTVDVPKIHDAYDAEVLFADAQVGRLLTSLRESGAWSTTAVAVTSDHGEGLWQHRVRDHSNIWNEQLEVPLILRVPGVAPARVSSRMLGRDFLPTLLGLLPGIDDEELLAQCSGVDVLAEGFEAQPRFTIVPPMPLLRDRTERPLLYIHALEHAGWRLVIGEQDTVHLYNLVEDPHEMNDLAEAEPVRREKLLALLERERDRQLARRDQLGAGEMGPMSEERLRALEALGYGGGADGH